MKKNKEEKKPKTAAPGRACGTEHALGVCVLHRMELVMPQYFFLHVTLTACFSNEIHFLYLI